MDNRNINYSKSKNHPDSTEIGAILVYSILNVKRCFAIF
jgi:hypothetical protein